MIHLEVKRIGLLLTIKPKRRKRDNYGGKACDTLDIIHARINADSLCGLSGVFLGIFIFHVHGGENLKIPDA